MPPFTIHCLTPKEEDPCQLQDAEKSKTEQFSEKTLQIINHAALALMMSIGHRTRPVRYDGRPAAVDGGAGSPTAAGLNERYVREWLGAMVTGGIVEYDAGSPTCTACRRSTPPA